MKNASLYYIRSSLINKLWTPTPKVEKPKPHRRGSPTPKYPDEVILEVRRLREECGWTCRVIAQRLGQDHNLDLTSRTVDQICRYSTRAHLVPEPGRKSPYIQPTV